MATLAEHRSTVELFVDRMHNGADPDALAPLFAEDITITGPLGDEPITGREAVTAAIQDISRVARSLTYREILSGETHHAAFFGLQIDDITVDGMDYISLDADGKIAAIVIFWRPLPAAIAMRAALQARGSN